MRNPNPIRRGLGAVLLALLLSLAAACGESTESKSSGKPDTGATGGTEAASYPMELTSPYGTTTLEKRPERVVVIGPDDVDTVLALGVMPLAATGWSDYADGDSAVDYMPDADKIEKTLEPIAGGADLEEVLALAPDLIVAVGGIEKLGKGYDDLAKIAPVVTYPEKLDSWAVGDPITTLRTIARPLDKAAEAEALIEDYQSKLAAVGDGHPEFAGKTITMVGLSGEGLYLFTTPDSSAEKFFSDLGFAPNPETAPIQGTVPEEKYDLIDTDVLVTLNISGATEESYDRLLANPLFNRLAVVGRGSTVHLDDSEVGSDVAAPLARPTVASSLWMLERVPDLLAAAAKAADGADE